MTRRIPPDEAFEYYASLGPSRSYAKVASHFGVARRSVTKHASRHGWSRRLLEIEARAREKSEQRMVDTLDEMNKRHLQVAKVIQAKALEALRSMPIESGMAAVRALDIGIRNERLVVGEPTDRNAVAVEDIIRREYQAWLGTATDAEWDALAAEGAATNQHDATAADDED